MVGWRDLLAPDIRAFFEENEGADVAALALKKPPYPHWPYKLILDQIKARTKARIKVPGWLDLPDIVFPGADLMEQASSRACALYKASQISGERAIDLTAGAGVDSAAIAERVKNLVCIEKNSDIAEILEHNLRILKKNDLFSGVFEVFCADSAEMLGDFDAFDWLYVDPQRRDEEKKGCFLFSTCSPDVTVLLERLKGRAGRIMVKTSPVLDLARGIAELGNVEAVHVVQWRGECKEVLYIVNLCGFSGEALIHAVDIDDGGHVLAAFSFTLSEERSACAVAGAIDTYIYEPEAAFMKAGAFNLMGVRFGLKKLHKNTHLYTGSALVPGFPGKVYKVENIRSAGDGAVDLEGAELVLRNYPGTEQALRNRLKLKQGSSKRIFACTIESGEKKLVICSKVSCQISVKG